MPEDVPAILLLEDDAAQRDLMRESLSDSARPLRVLEAATLEQARELLAKDEPELILCDYLLPDGKGIDLLGDERVARRIPVVLMTGFGDEKVAAEAIRRGALDYIPKTSETILDLRHSVERAIREWRLRRERDELRAQQQRRQSDHQAHELLDGLMVGCLIVDGEWRFQYANRVAAEFARSERSRLVGRKVWDVLPSIRQTRFFSLLERCMAERRECRETLPFRFPDNEDGIYDFLLQPLPDGVLVQCLEVGALHQARQNARHQQQELDRTLSERDRLEAELQRVEEDKFNFLAQMSHEIRTPLNGVTGLTRLLAESKLDETQARYVDSIEGCARHLVKLLNDILDYSKLEAGQLDIEGRAMLPGEVVAEVVQAFRGPAAEQGLEIEWEPGQGMDREVHGDPGRLRQILSSLVDNAVKFTEQGGIRISGHLHRTEGRALRYRFEVRDTGPGIGPEKQARLFKAFHPGGIKAGPRPAGPGLGLAMARNLCRLMGGDLEVESRLGRGSVIRFHCLFALSGNGSEALEPPAPACAEQAPERSPRRLEELRILMAEDNAVNRQVVEGIFSKYGTTVEAVEDGRQALRRFIENDYDLILMDVQMPILDGLRATEAIRREEKTHQRRRTPIVALTARAMKGDREACFAAGMDAYLAKPVVPDQLIETVERMAMGRELDGDGEAPEPPESSGSAERTDVPCIDFESLLARCVGKKDLALMLVRKFSEMAVKNYQDILEARDRGTQEELVRAAHTLKGSAANLSAEPIRVLSEKIELAAREDRLEGLPANLDALLREIEIFREQALPHVEACCAESAD